MSQVDLLCFTLLGVIAYAILFRWLLGKYEREIKERGL